MIIKRPVASADQKDAGKTADSRFPNHKIKLKMKGALFTATRILVFIVLLGKVLNWFLDFSDKTNSMLNILMFSLIGFAYIVMGWVWDNKVRKVVATTCGVFLIAMNFFDNTPLLNLIGIVCILTPMLIARFYKEGDEKINMPDTE